MTSYIIISPSHLRSIKIAHREEVCLVRELNSTIRSALSESCHNDEAIRRRRCEAWRQRCSRLYPPFRFPIDFEGFHKKKMLVDGPFTTDKEDTQEQQLGTLALIKSKPQLCVFCDLICTTIRSNNHLVFDTNDGRIVFSKRRYIIGLA